MGLTGSAGFKRFSSLAFYHTPDQPWPSNKARDMNCSLILTRFSLVLAFLVLSQFFCVAAKPDRAKPNIVFLLADDLGWADLRCYGSSFHDTPNIDQLAQEGVRFTSFYSAGSVCSPTRASILTGKYPPRTGITDWIPGQNATGRKLVQLRPNRQLALEEFTVAEALKKSGYQTFYVGKWHLGGKGYQPTNQGFDEYIGDEAEQEEGQEARLKRLAESTERFTGASIELLQKADRKKPFLLVLSYHDVHTPIQPMPGLVEVYERKAKGLEGETPRKAERRGQTRLRQDNAAYASMVAAVDQSVGRLREKISELGLEKDTVVVFTSDNGGLATQRNPGPTSNAPLRAGKGWLYEGGIRVPLIVYAPGVTTPGQTVDQPFISCDFYPTFLEMAGLPPRPDQHLDGLSLLPVLKGETSSAPRTLFWHYPHYHGSTWTPGAAVRDGDWKLIEFFEDQSAELYNLRHDLSETRDLAASNPEKTRELLEKLRAWRQSVGAQMPVADTSADGQPSPSTQSKKRKK
jgi:arylsulfatase A-like enzyme